MLSLKNMIKSAQYVCITADTWSSKSRRFIGMTVHWIDQNSFERRFYAMACRRLTGIHSYDRIAKTIESIHRSFGIDKHKITATVTDNGSNYVKAFNELGVSNELLFLEEVSELEVPQCEIDEDDCIEAEDFESRPDNCPVETLAHHIRCASHILNLVATTDVMKIIAATESLQSNYTSMLEGCNSL
ncbi:GSCOCG00011766001-RA-CDS [Cotesia congregata]|nr:GSCOCG00011766001-RA-CDS [Cotesia congregata]